MTDSPARRSPDPAGRRLRVVVVTNLWPSHRRPAWGSFVANRVSALRHLGHDVELVAIRDHRVALLRYARLAADTVRAVFRLARGEAPRRVVRDRGGSVEGEAPRRVVIEAHIAYPTGLFAYPIARLVGAPLVLFAHGSDVLRLPARSGADRRLARWLFGRADLVVANSDYLAEQTHELLAVERSRMTVVPPGIRYPQLRQAAEEQQQRDGLAIVANLIPRKGVDVLLAALAELARRGVAVPRLQVVGDGPERERLTQQASEADLPVRFLGALPAPEVAGVLAAARVVVVPSREEALGLAALESMAAGCVTVVAGVGGLAEVTVDGANGIVCAPESPADLADALLRAERIADDVDRWQTMAAAADATARDHDVGAVTNTTVQRYTEVLTPNQASRPDGPW